MKRMMQPIYFAGKCLALTPLVFTLGCANHLLIDRAELDAVEQCLAAQQLQQEIQEQQQGQILETLSLVGEMLSVQQQSLALHQFRLSDPPEPEPQDCPPAPEPEAEAAALEKQLVGEVEEVLLTEEGVRLKARIDTGATTASIDARDVQEFERNSEEWVRFTLIDPHTEEPVELERKRVRGVRIIQASTDESERRHVVELRITLGEISQTAEFTLANRSGLDYPMLIGRNILRDVMVVDVSKEHLAPLPDDERGGEE